MNENKKDLTNIMSRCIEDILFKIVDYFTDTIYES